MKYIAISTIALLGSLSGARGADYYISNFSQGPTDFLHADEFGNLLFGTNTIVTIGYFPSGFDLANNINNIPLLLESFLQQASSNVGINVNAAGPGNFPGYVDTVLIEGPILSPGNALIGRMLYSFAGNNAVLKDATMVSLNEVTPFVADDPASNFYTTNPSGRQILIGNVTQITGDFGLGSGIHNRLQLVPIPEPSAALLSAIGVLGLLRRRR